MSTKPEGLKCTSHLIGEVIPLLVEITPESENTIFTVIEGKTYCEVKKTDESRKLELPVTIAWNEEGTIATVHAKWDTKDMEPGYYISSFWVSLNFFEEYSVDGYLVEDARYHVEPILRYIK